MALIAADNGGSNYKPVPPGVYIARCYRIIDLGTQETNYQGEVSHKRQVLFGWELFGEDDNGNAMLTDDGSPMTVSKKFTLSLSKKSSLRAVLESWRGRMFTDEELRGFDLKNVLNAYCMINVTQTEKEGKTYTNVNSVTPIPSALKNAKPAGVNGSHLFDVTEPNMVIFDSFSEKLKEIIKKSFEWGKRGVSNVSEQHQAQHGFQGGPPAGQFPDDDIPFE